MSLYSLNVFVIYYCEKQKTSKNLKLTLWACCELSVSLKLTWWACWELFVRLPCWAHHAVVTVRVANSWKAHCKLTVWVILWGNWVSSNWAFRYFQFELTTNSLAAQSETHGKLIFRVNWQDDSHCELAVSFPGVCNSHGELTIKYLLDHLMNSPHRGSS